MHHAAAHMEVVVERLPVFFDAVRVFADELLAELFDHSGDGEGAGGGFAPACDAFVGLDFDEHVVARHAAWGGGCGDGGDGGDFHCWGLRVGLWTALSP